MIPALDVLPPEPSWRFAVLLSGQIALVVAAAAGVATLLGRRRPGERHLLWLVVLLRLALPLVLLSPLGLLPALGLGAVVIEQWPGAVIAGASAADAISHDLVSAWLSRGVAAAWIGGALLFGALSLIRAWQVRRRLARESSPAGPELRALVDELATEVGLRRSPQIRLLRVGSRLPSPALFGLWRPAMLLPSSVASGWTAETIRPVLVHELVHLRRRDHLVSALQWLVQVVYFFHPLVYLANERLRTERELACDDEVAHRCGTSAYLCALLALARERTTDPTPAPACVAMAEPARLLPRRIERMKNTEDVLPRRPSRRALATVAVLALAVVPLLLSAAQPPAAPAAPASASTSDDGDERTFLPGQDGVTSPKIIKQVEPKYPAECREERVEGKVVLKVIVEKSGDVGPIKVTELPEAPDERLVRAAADAVEQWRYAPATLEGEPVRAEIVVVIKFHLDASQGGDAEA